MSAENFTERKVKNVRFWENHPLSILFHVKTDRAAYCPGDTIQVITQVENPTTKTMSPHLELFQEQIYTVPEKQKKVVKVIQLLNGPKMKRENLTWETDIPLPIDLYNYPT